MDKEKEIVRLFSGEIRKRLMQAGLDYDNVREIRLRTNRPLQIEGGKNIYFLSRSGRLTRRTEQAYVVTKEDLRETLEFAGNYSLYAYEEELKEGFLTVEGGHRIGVAGKVVRDGMHVAGMRYITSVNVRISHEITGCARNLLPLLMSQGSFCHTLLISPPGCGKTTMLRDLVRQLAGGEEEAELPVAYTVGVVDERGEIAGAHMGIPTKDLGLFTDVLDGCPKAEGMLMLLRSMSPDILAVDEIGKEEDVEAISYASCCGCRVIATMHGNTLEELKRKPFCRKFLEEQIFERYVFLEMGEHPGQIREILDGRGNPVSILSLEGPVKEGLKKLEAGMSDSPADVCLP